MKYYILIALLFFCVVNFSVSCSNANSQEKRSNVSKVVEETTIPPSNLAVLATVKKSNIKIYGEWDIGEDSPLIYLVEKNESEDSFLILNSSGKVLYQNKVTEVEKVYDIFALRIDTSQLVFEYNEGGTDSFVEMLKYDQGKVAEIIEHTNGANSFGAGIIIQPQFRSDIASGKEPFEILLTDYGLASSAGKFTRILRYKNKKYQYFGKFDREKADDYKESIVSR